MKNERPVQNRLRPILPNLAQRSNKIANPRSKIMTNFNNAHKFTAAAAFGAAALFSMLSFGSNAEAASILSCKGVSAGAVASCCEQMVEKKGRPYWMIMSGTSCKEAAVCRGGRGGPLAVAAVAPVKRCYIRVVEIVKEGGNEDEGGNEGRGPRGAK
jgi:hypothetical protein